MVYKYRALGNFPDRNFDLKIPVPLPQGRMKEERGMKYNNSAPLLHSKGAVLELDHISFHFCVASHIGFYGTPDQHSKNS